MNFGLSLNFRLSDLLSLSHERLSKILTQKVKSPTVMFINETHIGTASYRVLGHMTQLNFQ